ncbi:MAG: OmpA family protein, partial [Rhizomicrobium sp.]
PQAADPAESALGAIKFLAGDLNAAMNSASARIQIQAYGGNRGDKGSDARRLSLKRALAVRQVLIDDGVPAERIDVRAMGGVDDKGPADRVDVYVKA